MEDKDSGTVKKKKTSLKRTSLKVHYFDDNIEELDDLSQLDNINLVTSVFYEEATRPSRNRKHLCSGSLWLRGRSNKHTVLYTDDPGELSGEEETNVETSEWINGVRSLSPSIIRPAPHWWERGPEVVTFIPTAPETSVAECMQEELGREELGTEIPYALGQQVEELMADHWETMRKKGKVGQIEDSRFQFNKMVANAQLDLLHLSKSLYEQRCEIIKQAKPKCALDVRAAVIEAFQSLCILDTTTDDSSSNDDDSSTDEDFKTSPRPHSPKRTEEPSRKSKRRVYVAKALETSSDESSDSSDKHSVPSAKKLSGNIDTETLSSASPSASHSVRRARKRMHFDCSPEMPLKKRKLESLSCSERVPADA